MAGYYSGNDTEEESDEDNKNVKGKKKKRDTAEDRTAREQMSNEPKRKNRRGQRARRKIWEKNTAHKPSTFKGNWKRKWKIESRGKSSTKQE